MTDFTKEELIAIRYNLSAGYTPEENSILFRVYEKIQSMIYNYCEHDWESGCASHECSAECVWCPKCKRNLINGH